MHDASAYSHLPYLLPPNVTHATFYFDQSRRPSASQGLPGDAIHATLDQLAPEFGNLDAIATALFAGELDAFVREPILRTHGADEPRTFRASLRLANTSDASNAGFALDVEDLTEIYALREQKRVLARQLEHYQAMVDMVSHDLNTPLTMLGGYLELTIAEMIEMENAPAYEYLHIMQTCVERITFTVEEMYDVVSMDAGHFRLKSRSVQTGELLRRVERETRIIAERRRQPLHVLPPQTLPAVEIDEMRILQVFQNIISNASKYSPAHRPITVQAALEPDRRQVRFTVSDQGSGIDAAHLPHIFDRAYRAPGAEQYAKGSGLGLHLARLIVEMHGGRIWCDSVVGQGSDFHFTLPVASALHDL